MQHKMNGKKFTNLTEHEQITFRDILHWQLKKQPTKWPKWIENTVTPSLPPSLSSQQMAITFINHATCLIQSQSINMLTDPVWSHRVSPFSFIGPARVRDPGLAFHELPHIDVVLISHNHYDHMDLVTLKALEEKYKPLFLVPLNNKQILKKNGLSNVFELNWWESFEIQHKGRITLVPAQHFSGRTLWDRDTALWGGYVFEIDTLKTLFAGDTGYASHFSEIAKKFGCMDIALLPIGAYEPRRLMKPFHMDPEEAVKAHLDLHSKLSIAIHFGTFQLTDEGIEKPTIDLMKSLDAYAVDQKAFRVLSEGETYIYTQAS